MRSTSAGPEQTWHRIGTAPAALKGRCQLGQKTLQLLESGAKPGSWWSWPLSRPSKRDWRRLVQGRAEVCLWIKATKLRRGPKIVVRPTFLKPSRDCSPTPAGSLEAPCNRSAPNYTASILFFFGTTCHQCHHHSVLWVPPRQAAPSSSHSIPCQRGFRGPTCCTLSSSSHTFKLDTGLSIRGTRNMQTGATLSPPFFSVA